MPSVMLPYFSTESQATDTYTSRTHIQTELGLSDVLPEYRSSHNLATVTKYNWVFWQCMMGLVDNAEQTRVFVPSYSQLVH